ncbi:dipeptidyl aminopeptidase/acylaminoacyl peptidase [Mumia flava]|uniref:Dipeptidyl aminopeptidase/acylaminoacyl peptidase n=1 Tax=Mumia flava TaxID=1348852 RepID=A0A0B2BQ92_9ACTN|nr:serine hydrolase [Mumia flava]PJJ53690.1 dipeptidyl aminopeptidase/acylaminoacyl peptidase [Mumia flava]
MTQRVDIDALYDLVLPEQPALSPDGTTVVHVVRTPDREADRDTYALWRVPATGGEARQLTRGVADTAPAWSPDGTRIAFLRSEDGPAQVWLLPVDGGEPEQVTTLPLGAGAPEWSPDGARIAFCAPVDLAGAGERPDTAAPRATERLGYKADGSGFLGTLRSHVHVLDLDDRSVRQVTRGDWHAGAPTWSPDGARLAFAAAREDDADLTARSSAWVVDARARTARPERVGPSDAQIGWVGWSRDGASLLAVGRTDTAIGHASVLRIALDDGQVTDLTAALDRNVMPGGPGYPGALPRETADGTLLFCARDRGCTHLYAVAPDGGEPRVVVGGEGRNVCGLSLGRAAASTDGTAAVVLGTPTSYGEVACVDLATGETTTLTAHGADERARYVPEQREFTISDGTVVEGWLVRDPEVAGPQPLLLDVHGGPHNAWNGAADPVHLYHQELASKGWAVLLLNPRASDGYGEAFFTATQGAWGAADERDFLEPLDQLVTEGLADAARLAITGYSYGGFMTCYLTSRDDRFAAAVAGGVVSDLISMGGTSDAGHYLTTLELGGADVETLSPLSEVGRVTTPTLVVQGDADLRCPVGQAEQWFSALRAQGVPSRLVLYPGGSHLVILNGPPSHRVDWNRRVASWVEEYATGAGEPRRVPVHAAHWQQRLTELASLYGVPGATLGIQRIGDDPVLAHHGVLNTATGVEVTDDSVFQIGSISKVWTATVVMQLVDEGLLDLDAPVAEVLPELRLSDPDAAKRVTMRHLLTHTSGIDGDVFTDTGRGDDCLETYVDQLEEAAQNHPLGATFSYCNSGFSLAGRVIEKVTGTTWDVAMRERLYEPLGLTHTVTLPEDALRFRAAMGHVGEGDADPVPAPVWGLPRAVGPAGLITATVADVLTFARMHLSGGVADDGTRVLGPGSTAAMTEHEVDVPDANTLGDSWGLGWIRFDWDGHRLIGHDGNTIGQAAFLRILPEQGLAVTMLTNGGNGADLYRDLFGEIFAELADVVIPPTLQPADPAPRLDPSAHLGTYERAGARIEILDESEAREQGRLVMRTTATGALAHLLPDPVETYELYPVEEGCYVLRAPGSHTWMPVVFYALPTGEPYVHFGARATPKVAT